MPYQIVVDPLTGISPGPGAQGRITGLMPTSAQTKGTLVGKMGKRTGKTEGKITGTYSWYGVTGIVADFFADKGDSGGPVWRWDGNGLRAVGVQVGVLHHQLTQKYIGAVYIPIETLLAQWGNASLPVFSSPTARMVRDDARIGPTSEQMILIPSGPPSDVPDGLEDVCADIPCEFVEG
ncbi:hypothetical protein [Microbacterium sp. No. 7]|uniref:hypothetical protein n=1 Tax=Microbacterium sp. No. 7 TaxID=1714373 RepID=UPI0012E219E5|nr:hypothetical protein [Microbacterium sp. No. 7]